MEAKAAGGAEEKCEEGCEKVVYFLGRAAYWP